MPNGQFPSIFAGTTLTASLLSSMVPLYAWKTGDTSRANTTVAADPDLSLTISAAGTYDLRGYINYEAGTTGAMQFTITSVGTLRYNAITGSGGTTTQGGGTVVAGGSGAGTLRAVTIEGTLITGATGTLTFNWAENATDVTPTIVHANSRISLKRMA